MPRFDLMTALRRLARSDRALTASAVVTLALGIGATTAIFTLLHGVVLAPLPYPEPGDLVRLYPTVPAEGGARAHFSLPDLRDWEAAAGGIASMGAYTTLPGDLVLLGGDGPLEVETAFVAGGFFPALGVEPLLGRWPGLADEEGDPRVLVVSHGLWQRRFGGEEDLVGAAVDVEGEPYTVLGVMPPGFAFPEAGIEAWALLAVIPPSSIPLEIRGVRFLEVVGRLAPGVSASQAAEELAAVARSLAAEHPDSNAGIEGAAVESLHEVVTGGVQRPLLLLQGAVAIVLLIACANVANLLLAQGVGRGREMGIRAALGASRGRLARQLLVESLVLAAAGGALGLLLAAWGADLLAARGADLLPRAAEVALDRRVLLFAAAVTAVTGLVFGAWPAVTAGRRDLASGLRQAGAGASSAGPRGRGRRGLVVAETAIAVLLLVGAGLMLKSLWRLARVDPGFEADRLLTVSLIVSDVRYPERADYMDVYRRLLERLSSLSGVESAGTIRHFPLRGFLESHEWTVPGRPEPPSGREPTLKLAQISPDLLATLGIPLLAGRDFTAGDREGGPGVVIVNRTLARSAFGTERAVGRRLLVSGEEVEVVGVAGDVRHETLAAPAPPVAYVPQHQFPRRGMAFVLRSSRDPLALAAAARAAVAAVDPDQPVSAIATAGQIVGDALARSRFFAGLLAAFAGLALALTSVGVYGVLSHEVRGRRRDFGIRLALGARPREVVALVLRRSLAVVLGGVALGLGASALATRVMESQLYGVVPLDGPTYLAAGLVLLAVAAVACYLPARAASRVAPAETLKAG